MRLITQDRVASISFSNGETFEEGLIKGAIIEAAQLRWIKPMLGNDLWDLLETESEAGSYSASNQTLVDKLEIPLAFFVKYEIIPDMSINQTAAGLQVLNTDFSTSATDSQRGNIQDQSLVHAKTILAEVTRWIEKIENSVNYPDYYKNSNEVSIKGGIIF